MKKLLSYLLVIALVLVQFVSVANAATITIENSVDGQTYNAYKIFDVTKAGNSYAYSIESTSEWFGVVQAYAKEKGTITLTRVGETTKYVVDASKVDASDFAAYLNNNKSEKNIDATNKGNGTSIDLSLEEAGYYFVDSSLGALCILHTAAEIITVNEKNEKPTVGKTVDKTSASVGETVTFTLTLTAGGKADTSYILHDTMSDGLTLTEDSFEITVDGEEVAENNYTITTSDLEDDCTFEIEFNQTYTASLIKGTVITVTYKAVVNKNAVEPSQVENEVKVQYGNTYSPEVEVIVSNLDFDVVKKDKEGTTLAGAQFKLYDALTGGNEIGLILDRYETEDGTIVEYYRPVQKGETAVDYIEAGTVSIKGLAKGTYYLEEIKAPEGYNQLTSRQAVSLESDLTISTTPVTVVNTTGSMLPSTGGMGTVAFIAIGSIMALGFGVLLVTKLRLSKMEI